MRRFCAAGCVLLLFATSTDDAHAHARSVSYSTWHLEGAKARVTLRLSLLELSRIRPDPLARPALDPTLAAYLTASLRLLAEGETCAVSDGPRALATGSGSVAYEWSLDCGERTPDAIESRFLLDAAPGHLHFARVRGAGGTHERVLSGIDTQWSLGSPVEPSAPTIGSSFGAYVALGVEHIATGYDHLVFLLALLLLASRLADVATIVTGFTIAHSITLALAVLGRLRPDAAAVEALIGLSIALVAAENAWLSSGRPRAVRIGVVCVLVAMAALASAGVGSVSSATFLGLALFSACYFAILQRVAEPVRLRVAVAFVFGLVHGFGFAGVLEQVQLAPGDLARALLGFNVGVELGQLAVVALLWPTLRALSRWRGGSPHRLLVELGTGAVAAMGVFWLVSRTYT